MKVYTKRLKDSHHFVTIEKKQEVFIMQRRYEISDEQWERIKEMFPRAKTGRPGKDSRLIFNAILWIFHIFIKFFRIKHLKFSFPCS